MRLAAAALVVLVGGCNAQSTAGVVDGTSALTFWKDIKPLMDAKCTMCHSDGGIAPFAFDGYADAISHLAEINVAVSNRVMPPWLAAPGCNDYIADRSLSDDQIKTITEWAGGGAKEGLIADYIPGVPNLTGALSRVDLTLKMPVAYTPQLSPDDYRCFILDWTPTGNKFVTGFRANAGNKSIVHHVIAYLATPANVAQYQKQDGKDGKPGYTCFGGPGGGGGAGEWIGAWAPGAAGYDSPAGTGILIPDGSKVILQVHYNTASTAAAADQTSLDFKIDADVQKKAFNVPWTNIQWVQGSGMTIPAGSPETMHSFDGDISQYLSYVTRSTLKNNQPFTMWSTSLHMHTHGIGGRVDLLRSGGQKECLLDIPRWDFHWQGGYGFQQAKTYNPGDQIHLECHWDNSKGSADLNWGEGTGDEMCLTGFYITQ